MLVQPKYIKYVSVIGYPSGPVPYQIFFSGYAPGDIYKRMLAEVDKMLKIYFTIPVTTATAERSFSSLRRLKTYLRNTSQSRLNNLFILYVHIEKTDEIDLKCIAREFVSVNQRRLNYFGKI